MNIDTVAAAVEQVESHGPQGGGIGGLMTCDELREAVETWPELEPKLYHEDTLTAELRLEVEGHRKAQAAVYLALGTDETDRDKWPELIKQLREAIAAWPELRHGHHCDGWHGWVDADCICGVSEANTARAAARKAAGLED